MIIRLSKLLIYGLEQEVSDFFERAQREGYIEFIGESSKKIKELPSSLKNYLDAITILKKQPASKNKEDVVKYDSDDVCERVIQIKNNIEHLEELQRNLEVQAAIIAPLGDFSISDIEYIKDESKHIFQFFTKKSSKQKIEDPPELIFIGREYDQEYFVSICKEKKVFPGYVEILVEMPIGVIKKRLGMIEEQLYTQREKLKSFSPFISLIKARLVQRFNVYNLEIAKKDTSKSIEQMLFSVEAWIPCNQLDEFKSLIKEFDVDFSVIAIEEKDRVPTCFQNKRLGRLGEDLVKIYDTPSTTDKDPSTWVLWFFSIFFAMIVGDAGYGLLFLLISLFYKFKIVNPKPAVQRLIKIAIFVSTCCIIWGVLTSSYFGIQLKPTNPLTKISVMDYLSKKKADYHLSLKDDEYQEWVTKYPKAAEAKNGKEFLQSISKTSKGKTSYEAIDSFNRNTLMELSLLVGMVHILIAFLRNLKRNFAGVGWCLFIIGGYLFFPSILKATSLINIGVLPKEDAYFIGRYLVYIGISSAVVLAIIQRGIGGLNEVMNMVSVFGDVLSYLRLYALGLAGMILSQTFNDMALPLNFVFGFMIILLGHSINIALCIMGGVIHGLRLNFLEWYNHCFEGGGKLFNPLKLYK